MSEELKAIDFLRAKTITYELSSEELHYSLILYNLIMNLQRENEKLKKQLENCYCNRTDCSGRIKDNKQYDSLMQKVESQQKKFIEWLEDKIKQKQKDLKDSSFAMAVVYTKAQIFTLQNALNEYKEIIGVDNEMYREIEKIKSEATNANTTN